MRPTLLTNEALRERRRRYHNTAPYPSLPSSSTSLGRHINASFEKWALTYRNLDRAYVSLHARYLEKVDDGDTERAEKVLGNLTRLQLLLENYHHSCLVQCSFYYGEDMLYFIARRQLVLFALYEGALGPDIPLGLSLGETADETDTFRLLGDKCTTPIRECIYVEGQCLSHVNDFLRQWVDADEDRARRYAVFCTMPASAHSIDTARREMKKKQ